MGLKLLFFMVNFFWFGYVVEMEFMSYCDCY